MYNFISIIYFTKLIEILILELAHERKTLSECRQNPFVEGSWDNRYHNHILYYNWQSSDGGFYRFNRSIYKNDFILSTRASLEQDKLWATKSSRIPNIGKYMQKNIAQLRELLKDKNTQEVLRYFLDIYKNKVAFASSLGAEDQVLTDILYSINPDAQIFTLDTGRLPKETYKLIEQTNTKYKKNIKVYFPDTASTEKLTSEKGFFSFYNSIDERKECCYIRKIVPLKRALAGLDVWITGLRATQSVTRETMHLIEWDESNNLIKINPLIEWSEDDVWDYIKAHKVPYNALHQSGYPSIGCEPCTRAVGAGEDIRSGRWWWENPEHKECGLHVKATK